MTFGISTVLQWDLGAVQKVGADLVTHENDLRRCFTDFGSSSDLGHAWSGSAADAQHTAAQTLAKDLYELSDLIGLLGVQVNRKAGELVEYQTAISKARSLALGCGCTVADDGTVTPPDRGPIPEADVPEEAATTASGFQETLKRNLSLAAAADIDLAKALTEAENTICQHATPATVAAAVAYVYGPSLHPVTDPFLADVPVGGAAPSPGDPTWSSYWQALTDLEKSRLLATWTSVGKGFNPYATIQGGPLPAWATQFNRTSQNACSSGTDGRPAGPGYGYFGGGTIMGPDGKPWPIVNPYYSDGQHVFLADSGAARTDGGIDQLDGHDAGWHTVTTYTGANDFGSVSTTTEVIVGTEVGTGQEIETNPTDPQAVSIGPDGNPVLGPTSPDAPSGPAGKPYWDVPQAEGYDATEASLAGNTAIVQGAQAAGAVNDVSSHGDREWQVQYQVNDDGRVRAVVDTYTAGPTEDGGTNVGGFANSFPTGQHGTTSEIPIDTRYNQPTGPTMTPGVPENVHYLGDPSRHGELIDNQTPIQEKLNK